MNQRRRNDTKEGETSSCEDSRENWGAEKSYSVRNIGRFGNITGGCKLWIQVCNEGYHITGTGEIHENNRVWDINKRARGTPKIGITRSRHTTVARKINDTMLGNMIPSILQQG